MSSSAHEYQPLCEILISVAFTGSGVSFDAAVVGADSGTRPVATAWGMTRERAADREANGDPGQSRAPAKPRTASTPMTAMTVVAR
ncbi:hypothetical protein Ais01nite_34210 [Asanoa ishikariensis]|nr:hypothetical protein Ais01nite_34210 [Asanoa ishikariensis]